MVKFLRDLFGSANDFDGLSALIAEAEKDHLGEIAVYVRERTPLFSKKPSRQEAIEQFAMRHIWDTEGNVGVLIFVCLGKRAIEIVADRGASNKIQSSAWDSICNDTIEIFRNEKNYQVGLEHAIKRVGEELRRALPGVREKNQIPDSVIDS